MNRDMETSISTFKYICIFIDDCFTNESLVKEVINWISNDALVFIMEFGNFNLIYNQCLVKGLETFNFIDTPPKIHSDLIIVFSEPNVVQAPWSMETLISKKIPIVHVRPREAVEYICHQCNQKNVMNGSLIQHTCQSTFGDAERNKAQTCELVCTQSDANLLAPRTDLQSDSDARIDERDNRAEPSGEPIVRARSFQFIDENNSDIFLDKCCKTFIRDDGAPDRTWLGTIESESSGGANSVCARTSFGSTNHPIWDSKNESEDNSKFMQVMLIEIKRLGFREKKEEFKKQIKKSSSNPSMHPIEIKKKTTRGEATKGHTVPEAVPKASKVRANCSASTKKNGMPCNNSALPGSSYCGIPSHKKLG
jgi:hypothetical protein